MRFFSISLMGLGMFLGVTSYGANLVIVYNSAKEAKDLSPADLDAKDITSISSVLTRATIDINAGVPAIWVEGKLNTGGTHCYLRGLSQETMELVVKLLNEGTNDATVYCVWGEKHSRRRNINEPSSFSVRLGNILD